MAGLRTLVALAAAAALLGVCQAQRFILVGNQTDPTEAWTQIGINYTQWQDANPLYVGDVAVFTYRVSYHVVWQLPDISDWDNCVYDYANFIGNDSAGVGAGFWFTVTSTPAYLACGVFGHCELGQKVIINGTLGPLPPKYIDSPPPSVVATPPPVVVVAASPPAVVASPPPVVASPPPVVASPPPVVASPPPVVASPPPVVASPPPVVASPPPVVASPPPVVASPPPLVASPPPVAASPPPVVASPPPSPPPVASSPPPVAIAISSPPPVAASPPPPVTSTGASSSSNPSPPPSGATDIVPTLLSVALLVASMALVL